MTEQQRVYTDCGGGLCTNHGGMCDACILQLEFGDLEEECSVCGGNAEVECDDYIQCTRSHRDWTVPDVGLTLHFCVCFACNGTGLAKDQVVW